MVSADGITKMTIHTLVRGAKQLGESLIIDDDLKACSPGRWMFSTLVFGSVDTQRSKTKPRSSIRSGPPHPM